MLRCLELLSERSPILTDLAMLADPARNPEPHEQAYWATILQYYTNVRPSPAAAAAPQQFSVGWHAVGH